MKTLSMLLLLLCPCICDAGELTVDINFASVHFNTEEKLNGSNFGLGVKYKVFKSERTAAGVQTGFYKNSYRNDSVYASLFVQEEFKYVNIGLQAGYVTGYKNNLKYPAMALLYVETKLFKNYTPRIGFIPSVKNGPAVMTFQLNINF